LATFGVISAVCIIAIFVLRLLNDKDRMTQIALIAFSQTCYTLDYFHVYFLLMALVNLLSCLFYCKERGKIKLNQIYQD